MMDYGKKEKEMGRDYIHGKMERHIVVNG